jgi:hypothetical protein
MEIREITAGDVDEIAKTSISRGPKLWPKKIGFSFCLTDNGKPLAAGGILMMTPQVAWVWLDFTGEATHKTVAVVRHVRDHMNALMAEHGIKRLMAAVDPSFPQALNLVQHLGFDYESTMASWEDGRPFYLYVIIGGP